jgi:large subunit ribosomal protein L25
MEFKLQAEKREKNEKLNSDFIPAVIYGNGLETRSLKIKKVAFDKIFSAAGESNLIELDVEGEKINALVKDLQRNFLKHTISHVDFYQVNMKEVITAEIPLHFVGESKAIKEMSGMLMRNINEIQVECLPNDLVDHIDVDISVINTFDDIIAVKDLVVPEKIKILHGNTEDIIVSVVPPKAQEEEVAPVEEVKAEDASKTDKKEEEKK